MRKLPPGTWIMSLGRRRPSRDRQPETRPVRPWLARSPADRLAYQLTASPISFPSRSRTRRLRQLYPRRGLTSAQMITKSMMMTAIDQTGEYGM
jgi:hypothetical protein